jgi:serine phosphatase RsbU (regulator of sigma subunit)
MALIRGMMSALLHANIAPSQIFTELTTVLMQCDSPILATAALAIVDIPTSAVTFATAGHPPPLLRRPDGSVEKLDAANGMMIGVSSDLVGEIGTAPFPLGSQLIMYTDGLVERRDRPLHVGIDKAASYLAALSTHLAPRHVIDSLHEALIGAKATDDDIAVLVVEHIA